jgi:organic radical activating enzyme
MAKSADNLLVSEVFHSLQGEGASLGIPTAFLRLANCNLHCTWCDTKYTWDFQNFDYATEVRELSVAHVAEQLADAASKRVVITGGEPLIQQAGLVKLLAALPRDFVIEVETNGTFAPLPELVERVQQWNVSPKLSNGGDPERLRIKHEALRALRDTERAFLKLVVQTDSDVREAEDLIRALNWPKSRVFFMPQATSAEELRERSGDVAQACMTSGVRFSTRLHLELWNGGRGK